MKLIKYGIQKWPILVAITHPDVIKEIWEMRILIDFYMEHKLQNLVETGSEPQNYDSNLINIHLLMESDLT